MVKFNESVITDFFNSIKEGDIDAFNEYYQVDDAIFGIKNSDGKNILHVAVEHKQQELIRRILEEDTEILIKEKDKEGVTPFLLVLNAYLKLVGLLPPIEYDSRDDCIDILNEMEELKAVILMFFSKKRGLINTIVAPSHVNQNILHLLIREKHAASFELAKELIKILCKKFPEEQASQKIIVNMLQQQVDNIGDTALHILFRAHHAHFFDREELSELTELIERLLIAKPGYEFEFNFEIKNKEGKSILKALKGDTGKRAKKRSALMQHYNLLRLKQCIDNDDLLGFKDQLQEMDKKRNIRRRPTLSNNKVDEGNSSLALTNVGSSSLVSFETNSDAMQFEEHFKKHAPDHSPIEDTIAGMPVCVYAVLKRSVKIIKYLIQKGEEFAHIPVMRNKNIVSPGFTGVTGFDETVQRKKNQAKGENDKISKFMKNSSQNRSLLELLQYYYPQEFSRSNRNFYLEVQHEIDDYIVTVLESKIAFLANWVVHSIFSGHDKFKPKGSDYEVQHLSPYKQYTGKREFRNTGYCLAMMGDVDLKKPVKKHILYIEKANDKLKYCVVGENEKNIFGEISVGDINKAFPKNWSKVEEVVPYLNDILRITSKRGHTQNKAQNARIGLDASLFDLFYYLIKSKIHQENVIEVAQKDYYFVIHACALEFRKFFMDEASVGSEELKTENKINIILDDRLVGSKRVCFVNMIELRENIAGFRKRLIQLNLFKNSKKYEGALHFHYRYESLDGIEACRSAISEEFMWRLFAFIKLRFRVDFNANPEYLKKFLPFLQKFIHRNTGFISDSNVRRVSNTKLRLVVNTYEKTLIETIRQNEFFNSDVFNIKKVEKRIKKLSEEKKYVISNVIPIPEDEKALIKLDNKLQRTKSQNNLKQSIARTLGKVVHVNVLDQILSTANEKLTEIKNFPGEKEIYYDNYVFYSEPHQSGNGVCGFENHFRLTETFLTLHEKITNIRNHDYRVGMLFPRLNSVFEFCLEFSETELYKAYLRQPNKFYDAAEKGVPDLIERIEKLKSECITFVEENYNAKELAHLLHLHLIAPYAENSTEQVKKWLQKSTSPHDFRYKSFFEEVEYEGRKPVKKKIECWGGNLRKWASCYFSKELNANLISAPIKLPSGLDFTHFDFQYDFTPGEEKYGLYSPYAYGPNLIIQEAKLRQSVFHHANFRKTDFTYSDLSYVDFSHADLRDVNFSNCNLTGAIFDNADLRGANLQGAKLKYVEFSQAKLEGVIFKEVMLLGTDFRYADFGDTTTSLEEALENCSTYKEYDGFSIKFSACPYFNGHIQDWRNDEYNVFNTNDYSEQFLAEKILYLYDVKSYTENQAQVYVGNNNISLGCGYCFRDAQNQLQSGLVPWEILSQGLKDKIQSLPNAMDAPDYFEKILYEDDAMQYEYNMLGLDTSVAQHPAFGEQLPFVLSDPDVLRFIALKTQDVPDYTLTNQPKFYGVTFQGLNFSKIKNKKILSEYEFLEAKFFSCKFSGLNLSSLWFYNNHFDKCSFERAELDTVRFKSCRFSNFVNKNTFLTDKFKNVEFDESIFDTISFLTLLNNKNIKSIDNITIEPTETGNDSLEIPFPENDESEYVQRKIKVQNSKLKGLKLKGNWEYLVLSDCEYNGTEFFPVEKLEGKEIINYNALLHHQTLKDYIEYMRKSNLSALKLKLKHIEFSRNCKNLELKGMILKNCSFEEAESIEGINFYDVSLDTSTLRQLVSLNSRSLELIGTKLIGDELDHGEEGEKLRLSNINFKDTQFDIDVSNIIFDACSFIGATFNKSKLHAVEFSNCTLTNTKFDKVEITMSLIEKCRSEYGNLLLDFKQTRGCKFEPKIFFEAYKQLYAKGRINRDNLVFRDSALIGNEIDVDDSNRTVISDISFSDTILNGMNLTNLVLKNCDFQNAQLEEVDFFKTKFVNCTNLTPKQWSKAKLRDSTVAEGSNIFEEILFQSKKLRKDQPALPSAPIVEKKPSTPRTKKKHRGMKKKEKKKPESTTHSKIIETTPILSLYRYINNDASIQDYDVETQANPKEYVFTLESLEINLCQFLLPKHILSLYAAIGISDLNTFKETLLKKKNQYLVQAHLIDLISNLLMGASHQSQKAILPNSLPASFMVENDLQKAVNRYLKSSKKVKEIITKVDGLLEHHQQIYSNLTLIVNRKIEVSMDIYHSAALEGKIEYIASLNAVNAQSNTGKSVKNLLSVRVKLENDKRVALSRLKVALTNQRKNRNPFETYETYKNVLGKHTGLIESFIQHYYDSGFLLNWSKADKPEHYLETLDLERYELHSKYYYLELLANVLVSRIIIWKPSHDKSACEIEAIVGPKKVDKEQKIIHFMFGESGEFYYLHDMNAEKNDYTSLIRKHLKISDVPIKVTVGRSRNASSQQKRGGMPNFDGGDDSKNNPFDPGVRFDDSFGQERNDEEYIDSDSEEGYDQGSEAQDYSQDSKHENVELINRFESLGLAYQALPGDGHCLYNAVGVYLGQTASDLRDEVATYLENNRSDFLPFIENLGENYNVDDYIYAVRNTDEWASEIEMQILIQVLKRPIVVLIDDAKTVYNSNVVFDFVSARLGANNNNNISLNQLPENVDPIFVYYNNHNHYDALCKTEQASAEAVWQQLRFTSDTGTHTTMPKAPAKESGIPRGKGKGKGKGKGTTYYDREGRPDGRSEADPSSKKPRGKRLPPPRAKTANSSASPGGTFEQKVPPQETPPEPSLGKKQPGRVPTGHNPKFGDIFKKLPGGIGKVWMPGMDKPWAKTPPQQTEEASEHQNDDSSSSSSAYSGGN